MTLDVCFSCRYEMSYGPRPNVTDPLGTTGQRDRWGKHSKVSTGYAKQSVLDNPTSSYYVYVAKLTVEKGTFREAENTITYTPSAGSRLGWLYNYGSKLYELDTLNLVGLSHTTGTHLYLVDSKKYLGRRCHFCGRPC